MKQTFLVALGVGLVVSSAAAIHVGAVLDDQAAQPLTRAELDAILVHISSDADAAIAQCELTPLPSRELCRAQAQAREMVDSAIAELKFRRSGEAARVAQRARIDGRYLVDRAHCTTLVGSERDSCLIAVHAVRGRKLLEAATPYRELASS